MASSAPKVAGKEHHEALDSINRKAQILTAHIRKSKHLIAFTGAGISTSAGIPDFRGPDGVWTLKRQGRMRDLKAVNTVKAIPTPTHMALVELQNRGILKYLVSQNCDGLHRKSGVLPKCSLCGGVLHDSIIHFGESLPAQPVNRARDHAKKADLCLVLGSSLTVTPANEIPEMVVQKRSGKLVICNLQDTPIDHLCETRIHCPTDKLMMRLMENLGLPIPAFVLTRRLLVQLEYQGDERHRVTVSGLDVDGTPATFLKSIKLSNNRRVARSEPFVIDYRGACGPGTILELELEFMGHYNEPDLRLSHVCSEESEKGSLYLLEYDPLTGQWQTTRQDDADTGEGEREDMDMTDDCIMLPNAPIGSDLIFGRARAVHRAP
ncbi:MAG: hypothetical protein Q9174_006274 [Haloplaca sp. 1 TL-2023]